MDNRIMWKKKPAGWSSIDLDFTEEMAGYIPKLAKLENDIGAGLEDGRYFPHDSLEGGKDTIGFGHKIGEDPSIDKDYDFSKGLSKDQAMELLTRDTLEAYRRAYNSYKNEYSVGEWNKLSNKAKIALTDISFNIGNIKDYKSAFKSGDMETIKSTIRERGYTAKDVKNSLSGRNEAIIKDYIDPKEWSEESNYMRKWIKEDNLLA